MANRRWRAAVVAVVVVVAACSSGGEARDEPSPEVAEPPEVGVGELSSDVRSVPDPPPRGEPGALVALAPRTGPDVPAGAQAWDVLYLSEGIKEEPVVVSGVVFAPGGPVPDEPRPVVSWAHGSVGVADVCAPSRTGVQVPDLAELLDAGYVVAATDYEGLGTPGAHPYLVGVSEGRGVLDAARAASLIEGAGAGSRVVALGHSQGGQGVLFAGQLASDYAPELDLVGVVASAPAAELSTLLRSAVPISLGYGLVSSGIYAYSQAYDELVLADVLTPAAIDRLGAVEEVCLSELTSLFARDSPSSLLVANPLDVGPWAQRVEQNEPGSAAIAAPVLVVQGGNDFIVFASSTDTAVERLCQGGNVVDYRRYPGIDHAEILGEAGPEILSWLADRFAGRDASSTCG
ncbi:MAG: lipase family protein [Actinomycetota bacterium]|nr:lipase family protein [Actinomycetota bacterium]